jgi:hypothetical protein
LVVTWWQQAYIKPPIAKFIFEEVNLMVVGIQEYILPVDEGSARIAKSELVV